jgi:hypothetical protein
MKTTGGVENANSTLEAFPVDLNPITLHKKLILGGLWNRPGQDWEQDRFAPERSPGGRTSGLTAGGQAS